MFDVIPCRAQAQALKLPKAAATVMMIELRPTEEVVCYLQKPALIF